MALIVLLVIVVILAVILKRSNRTGGAWFTQMPALQKPHRDEKQPDARIAVASYSPSIGSGKRNKGALLAQAGGLGACGRTWRGRASGATNTGQRGGL
jgi:hypothetical protein